MLLERPGQERLKMGCSMHATAQALAKASLSQRHPGVHPVELKRLLFLHFYGADFEPKERKRIALALARRVRCDGRGRKLAMSGAVREKAETYRRKRKSKPKPFRPPSS
jgi:hypothetical protein